MERIFFPGRAKNPLIRNVGRDMFKFLKKKHFFDEWKATSSVVSPFVPELGKIGEVKLGDRIDRLACMGRPHDYKQADKGRYSLEYPGLTVECEDGFLTYIGCMFGSVEVRTVDGRPVGSGLSVEQVMDLYGGLFSKICG